MSECLYVYHMSSDAARGQQIHWTGVHGGCETLNAGTKSQTMIFLEDKYIFLWPLSCLSSNQRFNFMLKIIKRLDSFLPVWW